MVAPKLGRERTLDPASTPQKIWIVGWASRARSINRLISTSAPFRSNFADQTWA